MKDNSFLGRLRTLLDLMRLRNVLISFLGVYIGALLFQLGGHINWSSILSAAFSAGLIMGGGNALNDYFDFEIDRINRPKRPIPSGRITRSDTFMLSCVLFLLGLGMAKSINNYCFLLAFANTIMLILYAVYSKRMLLASNLSISYLVASVFIYGAAAAYSPAVWVNPDGVKLVSVLTLCSFFINFSREVIKDIEDIEGDRKAYSRTLPIEYGPDNAKKIAFCAGVLAIIFSFTPIVFPSVGFNELLYGVLIIISDMILLASYTTSPTLNQRILVFGMTLALLAFLVGVSPQYVNVIRRF